MFFRFRARFVESKRLHETNNFIQRPLKIGPFKTPKREKFHRLPSIFQMPSQLGRKRPRHGVVLLVLEGNARVVWNKRSARRWGRVGRVGRLDFVGVNFCVQKTRFFWGGDGIKRAKQSK